MRMPAMRFEDSVVSELSQWLEEVSKLLYPFVAGFSEFWILTSVYLSSNSFGIDLKPKEFMSAKQ